MRSAVSSFAPLPDVVVHAPRGFDPSAPLHLVIVLHGMGHTPLIWLAGGLPDPRTGLTLVGWGAEVRHDLAGTRSLILGIQCDDRRGRVRLGRLQSRGGFRRFLEELLGETLAPRLGGPRSLDAVASVTLVGSSAGGPSVANLLDVDDLDGRVRNVVLFDALYGSTNIFARWLRGGDRRTPRRLVCLHAGSRFTAGAVAELVGLLRPSLGDLLVVQPRGSITEAVRTHRAVFAAVDCEHICMGPAYLDKVLLGLELPARSPDVDPKTPASPHLRAAVALVPNTVLRGSLDPGDPAMRDGSAFDDYAVDLAAGQSVTLDLRGGEARGFLCRSLDMQLRVLEGETVLADDDDSGGGLASRVVFPAPRSGRYIVRAMAHGPWGNYGSYTLRVAASLFRRSGGVALLR